MIDQLIQIGFNENEAKVYIACLEMGKSSIAPLVQRSGVSKKRCYKALDRLIAEGYVAAEGRRKKVFSVTDVEAIGLRLQEQLRSFHSMLPQLYAASASYSSDRDITLYHDEQSIRNAYKRQMRKEKRGGVSCAIESAKFHFIEFMNAGRSGVDFDVYEQNRLHRDIALRLMFVDAGRSFSVDFETDHRRKHREIRVLSTSVSNSILNLHIWTDRVFLLSQRATRYSLIEIANRDIRNGFFAYFETLWEQGKTI